MIARAPSVVFAALWLVWYGFVVAALFRPDDPTFGLGVLLAFLPIEAVAVFVDTGKRDTLSELQTWVNRKLSKPGVAIWRGWNALLLILVFLVCYLLWRVLAHYSGSVVMAWIVAGLTAIWLSDHWREPEVYG